MRYVIYGAGAIGGVIAARLARAGRRVVAIARGEHLAAVRAKGLRFESPRESFVADVEAVGHPGELAWEPEDVVFLCTKTQDSEAALLALREAAGSSPAVVCAQNGVANERMALRRFDRVYAMVVMLPATHLEPGLVVAQSKAAPGILDLGRYPGGIDAEAERIAADLEGAAFSARPDPEVMRFKYTKLLMNLGNALHAACGADPAAAGILAEARAEAERCYAAAGIDHASAAEFAERRGDLIQPVAVGNRTRGGSSSWQSLARKSGSIEADYLNGEIALLGRQHGIPTPTNATLQDVSNELAAARGAPGSVPLDELKRRIEARAR
ncbi:MAG: ketopantoate reductase family protein [Myxococcota bacterium]